MSQILVVKPNSIKPDAIDAIEKKGIVIIEHENPEEVRVITSMEGYNGDDVFMAAIETIDDFGNEKGKKLFAEILTKKIKSRGKLK